MEWFYQCFTYKLLHGETAKPYGPSNTFCLVAVLLESSLYLVSTYVPSTVLSI